MKKRLVLFGVIIGAIIGTLAINPMKHSKSSLLLNSIESIAQAEMVIDLEPVVITCPAKGTSGRCHLIEIVTCPDGKNIHQCQYTGKTTNYCNGFLAMVCTLIGRM